MSDEALSISNFVVPDAIEPIYSWRSWRLVKKGASSVTRKETVYEGMKPIEAKCPFGCTEVPAEMCQCGLYSSYSLREPWSYLSKYISFRYTLIGVVASWGKVITGSSGLRSQFSYPQFLMLLPPSSSVVEERIKVLKLDKHAPAKLLDRTEVALDFVHNLYKVPVLVGPTLADGRLNINAMSTLVEMARCSVAKDVLLNIQSPAFKGEGMSSAMAYTILRNGNKHGFRGDIAVKRVRPSGFHPSLQDDVPGRDPWRLPPSSGT